MNILRKLKVDDCKSTTTVTALLANVTECCYMLFSREQQQTLPDMDLYVSDIHALSNTRVDHYTLVVSPY